MKTVKEFYFRHYKHSYIVSHKALGFYRHKKTDQNWVDPLSLLVQIVIDTGSFTETYVNFKGGLWKACLQILSLHFLNNLNTVFFYALI